MIIVVVWTAGTWWNIWWFVMLLWRINLWNVNTQRDFAYFEYRYMIDEDEDRRFGATQLHFHPAVWGRSISNDPIAPNTIEYMQNTSLNAKQSKFLQGLVCSDPAPTPDPFRIHERGYWRNANSECNKHDGGGRFLWRLIVAELLFGKLVRKRWKLCRGQEFEEVGTKITLEDVTCVIKFVPRTAVRVMATNEKYNLKQGIRRYNKVP